MPADGPRRESRSALVRVLSHRRQRPESGADSAPPFATIARKPGFDGSKIAQFLMDPYPKMPDMQLSRDEAKDLGAYIASLVQ